MKILNLGSLNIDKVYSVDHFVKAGETLAARTMETFSGGKGLNQSLALARAGAEVYHAGAVGADGEGLRVLLEESGVNLSYLQTLDTATGHAIIQLTPQGQNSIIISAGANGLVTKEYIDEVLAHFDAGDLILLQNEISNVDYAMRRAKERGLRVAFNASPVSEALLACPLELVDYYIINEVEGKALSGCESEDYGEILTALRARFPEAAVVLTVGGDGVLYEDACGRMGHGIYRVQAVDTTAAGDTFCGYFLACLTKGMTPEQGLETASMASALAVSRKGAANSIPTWEQVQAFARDISG